jgi:hypothetical protein
MKAARPYFLFWGLEYTSQEGGKDAFALRSQRYDIEFDDPYAVIMSISE